MSLHVSDVQPRRSDGRFKPAYEDRTLSHGEPAEPLLGVLPFKRWIPQDVHSVMDYVDGLTVATGYFMPENKRDDAACWASIALGASVVGVSLFTDYRLSAMKLIPIRAHVVSSRVTPLSGSCRPEMYRCESLTASTTASFRMRTL